MAHNIYIDQFKKASFFSAREKAWHGLGTITEGALTSEEALRVAGLDYDVIKQPLYFSYTSEGDGSQQFKNVKDNFATVRTDTNTALGIVGKKYTIVQNRDAFDFFDAIVGRGEAIYETAGALGNGEIVFITAKLPGHIRVPGEAIEKYLLLKLTHDGTGSIIGGFTPVRVVCNNTLSFAMGHQGRNLIQRVSIRHTASVHDKLQEAHRLMGIANQLTEELGTIWTTMKNKKIVDKDVKELFERMVLTKDEIEERSPISTQKKNQLNELWFYYNNGIGQDSIIGTQFGAYNAVAGYYQNAKATSNPQGLLKSNLFGYNAEQVKGVMRTLISTW